MNPVTDQGNSPSSVADVAQDHEIAQVSPKSSKGSKPPKALKITKKRMKEDLLKATLMLTSCRWEEAGAFFQENPHVLGERVIKSGAVGVNHEGETLLGMAACEGPTHLVRLMIREGASVNQTSLANGVPPLNEVYRVMVDCPPYELDRLLANAKELVKAGAWCDFVWPAAHSRYDHGGYSPLYHTRGRMPPEALELLLAGGANVNECCEVDGRPGIAYLIRHLHQNSPRTQATLQRLLQEDVNMDPAVSNMEHYPLYTALATMSGGWQDFVDRGARLDFCNNRGQTFLHIFLPEAAYEWVLSQAPHLIEVRDREGNTPLLHALKRKNHHAAKCLIAAGADMDTADIAGRAGVTPRQLLQDPDLAALARMVKSMEAAKTARSALDEITRELGLQVQTAANSRGRVLSP